MQKVFAAILGIGLLTAAGNALADPISDLANCMDKGRSIEECHRSEAQRYVEQIEAIYEKHSKEKFFDDYKMDKTSSNPEKFRKLLNMWKLFAQNYCKLINYTIQKSAYSDTNPNECLYNMAIRHLHEIESIESIKESDTF